MRRGVFALRERLSDLFQGCGGWPPWAAERERERGEREREEREREERERGERENQKGNSYTLEREGTTANSSQ